MSERVKFTLAFHEDVEKYIQKNYPLVPDYKICLKTFDARGASRGKTPVYHYEIELSPSPEDQHSFRILSVPDHPVIVGSGPAGLFCALRLNEYGIKSIILERGECVQRRTVQIARFWRYGDLDPESNVCFGEGGAGLFSDGKLLTRVKSPFNSYVFHKLIQFGASPDILYTTHPHIGSNKLRTIISAISAFLKESGHRICYSSRVEELILENGRIRGVALNNGEKIFSDHVILATGHSAHDVYQWLYANQIPMAPKNFAVGVRIEHPRTYIDRLQYGSFANDLRLGAARYRLSHTNPKTGKGVYTFCMCPGGYVLSTGTSTDGIVVNGMSNHSRNSKFSNSAIVVTVKNGEDFGIDETERKNILAGMEYQRMIENNAYRISQKFGKSGKGFEIPALTLDEFLTDKLNKKSLPPSSSPTKLVKASLHEIFPQNILDHLKEGIANFDRNLKGYHYSEALLFAPETRTSAPVTIIRENETCESPAVQGLYPCGEGAGQAGGITSSATDGVRVAESIVKKLGK